MFGPNTYTNHFSSISFSHRDKNFIKIFKRVNEKFASKFNLEDYDILFIPGSGTIGMEAIFFSTLNRINVIGNDGVFKKKWENFSKLYNVRNKKNIDLFCSLETSNSSIFEKNGCIIDAISSFPYYEIPENTHIFATCSNKQIGSFPGLSIVAVKKNYWLNLKSPEIFSYLNLSRYKEFSNINQTPSTAPTQLFEHLEKVIDNFNILKLRDKINSNSKKITDAIGIENIIGETVCPVITFNKKLIATSVARKFNLYGLNTKSNNYQIFTYSCDDHEYESFCNEVKK